MARKFPTNSLIRSEFQYFAIQQKFEKNHLYQKSQEHLFRIIIISESCEEIGEENNCSMNIEVAYPFFHFK